MATSGKKGKKTKGKPLSLQDFLATGGGGGGGGGGTVATIQVPRKVTSWADECEEDDYDRRAKLISLPTAPRASRVFNDDSVPHSPPFLAYISNLPYDVNDSDIHDFFDGLQIISVRLPREDGENGRLRGFGYIEFETREDLIEAVSLPDPVIRNRRIRIDVSNENDQKRGGQRNNRFGGDRDRDDRDQTNWRRGNENNINTERESDNRRGFGGFRDRDRERDRERDSNNTEGGNWRSGDRPNLESPPPQRRGFSGDSSGFKDRFGGRRIGFEDRNKRDGDPPVERERPKLNLKPRTLPIEPIIPVLEEKEERIKTPEIPSVPKAESIPAAKIFGDAKPVDTSAREREIEERMERERLAKLKEIEENKEKEKLEKEKLEKEKENVENHEIISIKLEKSKVEDKKEEIISWRKRADEPNDDSRRQSPHRRFSPDDKRQLKRHDDRDRRGYREHRERDRDYHRDRDYKDREGRDGRDNRDVRSRENKDHRDNRHDYKPREKVENRGERSYKDNKDDRGNNREIKTSRRDKEGGNHDESRDIEDRMPKYKPPEGPNLSMSNKFAFLNDDDD